MANRMAKFIKKMNEMFEANVYTDKGRVVVDYAPNTDMIVVKVLDKAEVIDVGGLTQYGIMFAVMEKLREMYD